VITLEFTTAEVELLRTLLTQYDEILQSRGDDPALERLFPVAYRDDPDAAAEFARYTRSGLVEHKSSAAGAIAAAIAEGGSVQLDPPAAERWLPVLTDLRLVIAQRLGIVRDEDEVPRDPLGEVYHWLAELQTYLIDAIEALE
jgi:hypothetical protein